MNRNQKQAILYLALSIVGIILLAASLPDLRFQAGLPIPGAETTPAAEATLAAGSSNDSQVIIPWLLQGALALGFLLLLVAFIVTLLRKASKKRIGLAAGILLILIVVAALLPRAAPGPPDSFPAETPGVKPAPADYAIAPIGDPPPGLLWLVVVGLLLLAALVGAWLLLKAFRSARKEDLLGREIGEAIQAIEGGQDLHGVIIRCYLQMESVVKAERGVERESSVTPREFENHLAAKGIARAPIRQLTRLFEQARYGDQGPAPQDEQAALDCLTAIRTACALSERGSA